MTPLFDARYLTQSMAINMALSVLNSKLEVINKLSDSENSKEEEILAYANFKASIENIACSVEKRNSIHEPINNPLTKSRGE